MTHSVIETLRIRARIYQKIRAFFYRQGYLEVDTPLLARSTNTDIHINSIAALVNGKTRYLQTSPEFFMKRLLCAGSGSIFQIGHAFRDEEQGRRHQAEFSLLEWYSMGFDYLALMDQLENLVGELVDGETSFRRIRYFDCFRDMLELDPANAKLSDCQHCVTRYITGIDATRLSRDECLDLLISQVIARQFKGFVFVYDYPASQASLARIKVNDPLVAERFELFHNDMELANGFSELADADEQRERFEQDLAYRHANGLPIYPVDEAFLQALAMGMPDCAGVAVGIDRLLMLIMGRENIQSVAGL